jgi:hypothetical protein
MIENTIKEDYKDIFDYLENQPIITQIYFSKFLKIPKLNLSLFPKLENSEIEKLQGYYREIVNFIFGYSIEDEILTHNTRRDLSNKLEIKYGKRHMEFEKYNVLKKDVEFSSFLGLQFLISRKLCDDKIKNFMFLSEEFNKRLERFNRNEELEERIHKKPNNENKIRIAYAREKQKEHYENYIYFLR